MHTPSMDFLERHLRDIDAYSASVSQSAPRRYDAAFWGLWEQHAQLPEHGVLVDLGAGSGHLLSEVRKRHPVATLRGVELHPRMLALFQAAAEQANLEVVHADIGHELPLDAASADVVTSVLSFHELPYPPALLAQAARLLKPGGRLLLVDIVKMPLAHYLQNMREADLSEDTLAHFREHCLFTPEDLAHLVRLHGLVVDEVALRKNGMFAVVMAHKPAET